MNPRTRRTNGTDITPLDPIVSSASPVADDPVLADILASDRTTPAAPGLPPQKHRAPVAWLAGGGVVAIGVIGVVVFSLASPTVTPPAFADWTPQPDANITAQQQQQAAFTCDSLAGGGDQPAVEYWSNVAVSAAPTYGPPTIILDVRGSYHATLVAWSSYVWTFCSNLESLDGSDHGIEVLGSFTPDNWTPPAGDITVLGGQANPVFGNDKSRPIFEYMYGVAGVDITKLQVVTNQGVTVDASLKGGYWLVYGPIDPAVVNGFAQFLVTRVDGTVTTIQVPPDFWLTNCSDMSDLPTGLVCLPEPSSWNYTPSPSSTETASGAPSEPVDTASSTPAASSTSYTPTAPPTFFQFSITMAQPWPGQGNADSVDLTCSVAPGTTTGSCALPGEPTLFTFDASDSLDYFSDGPIGLRCIPDQTTDPRSKAQCWTPF